MSMKRKVLTQIQAWYQATPSRPLLLTGPKGVGKTHVILDYLNNYEGNKVYLNVEMNPGLLQLFVADDLMYIVNKIAEYFSLIQDKETILILDECYSMKEMVSLILRDHESISNIKFILISSYPMEVSCMQTERVQYESVTLYPLDFEEFLYTTNNKWYVSVIKEHFNSCRPIPDIVHEDILKLFYTYLTIGGMPIAINEFLSFDSTLNSSEQHQIVLAHQLTSMKNTVDESTYLKINQIIDSIDIQLAKKNKKFQYRIIRKGVTYGQYKEAMELLERQQIVLPCSLLGEKKGMEKIYLYDTGLLVTKAKLTTSSKDLDFPSELYKGILENYIAQTLHSNDHALFYWESQAQAKLDFVIQKEESYIPIEVYHTVPSRSKAVSVFKTSYATARSIKISANNFSKRNDVLYLPYYAAFCI